MYNLCCISELRLDSLLCGPQYQLQLWGETESLIIAACCVSFGKSLRVSYGIAAQGTSCSHGAKSRFLVLRPIVPALFRQVKLGPWQSSLLYQLWQYDETENVCIAACFTSCDFVFRLSHLVLRPIVLVKLKFPVPRHICSKKICMKTTRVNLAIALSCTQLRTCSSDPAIAGVVSASPLLVWQPSCPLEFFLWTQTTIFEPNLESREDTDIARNEIWRSRWVRYRQNMGLQ